MTDAPPPQIPAELRPDLDTIADRLLSGHAAVMIGAGFSKNAASPGSRPRFPNWSDLGDRFHERLHGRPPAARDRYLHVPTLAHQVEAAFGRPALEQMLRDAIPDLQHEPSPIHAELLDLPWSDVFTTNYDTLLERARRSVISQRYDLVLRPTDLTHSNRPRIVKLHGSRPSHDPFVITDEDYRRYPHDFAPFVNVVRHALLEHTLCLIGFSGDDPNFLQWIGWLHDNLGARNVPKMYLVGLLDLSPSQRKLLDLRNIVPVDLSLCPNIAGNHYQAIQHFLRYLHLRRAADNPLDWPRGENPDPPSHDDALESHKIRTAVELWKAQRRQYPGWVVTPEDIRASLRHDTSPWLDALPATTTTLFSPLDLEFAFELTWRMEKLLYPIFDNQVQFIESTIDRYWHAAHSEPSTASQLLDLSELTPDAIRLKCHHLALVLMRYHREEGHSSKWDDAHDRIHSVLPTCSPDHQQYFNYERAMFSLFTLDLRQLKASLAEWPHNDALPFWAAKKAALLAEIGQVAEAEGILEQSLDTIRTKLNLTPATTDYTFLSQESFVMCLLHAMRQGAFLTAPNHSDAPRQHHEFRERWHVLRQYKCDPWQELKAFEQSLQRPPTALPEAATRPTFDIGRLVQTSYPGRRNNEALTAYKFLRFCEDAGIPFQVPGCTIAAKSAAGTLARIAQYSSHWALATLVRTAEPKAVDQIFDRTSLARMRVSTVDGLIEGYLNSLRSALPDITTGDRWRQPNFGTLLAGIFPEILSRLCCKCSRPARERLLDWLLQVYRSDHRSNYQGIRVLMRRLMESFPLHERIAMVPTLLKFPIIADLNPIEEREYEHPFVVFHIKEIPPSGGIDITNTSLEAFFDGASSDQLRVRRSAISALAILHDAGMLDPALTKRFAKVLWSRVDEYGLPSGTSYYRFAFLSLPRPVEVDPLRFFMQYIRRAQFPAQKDKEQTTMELGAGDDVALCHDICAARVAWSSDDLRSIADRLVKWWDTDKTHVLKAAADGDSGPFPSIAAGLRRRLSGLLRTLAEIVIKYSDSIDDEPRGAVMRVADECAEYDVPALRLNVACVYAFAGNRDLVLQRIEDALASSRRDTVIDALEAMDLVSRRSGTESIKDDLARLLTAAGQMVRWRRTTAFWATLDAVGDVVRRHRWTLSEDVERSVLAGLDALVTETAIGGASRAGVEPQGENHDVSWKLVVRRAAARLAYRFFQHYQTQECAIPEAIEAWRTVCGSDAEFLEIKNEWMD